MRVIIDDPHVHWSSCSDYGLTVYSCGYSFCGDSYMADEELTAALLPKLLTALQAIDRRAALTSLWRQLNGAWAVIAASSSGEVVAATDITRSFPLFYSSNTSQPSIAWSPHRLLDVVENVKADENAAVQFFTAGLISGRDTLFSGIKELCLGECLYYDSQSGKLPEVFKYYQYLPEDIPDASEEDMQKVLYSALDNVFGRYYKAYGNQHIAVPFSGGADSRVLAAMLKRHDFKHVTCFTYGRADSPETLFSKEAVEAIGYEWRFIEYDRSTWSGLTREELDSYWDYSCRGVGIPHLLEQPAIRQLATDYPGDGALVYMPGHTALDAYRTPWELVHKGSAATFDDLLHSIMRFRFMLWLDRYGRLTPVIRESLSKELSEYNIESFFDIYSHHNRWCIENRETKYIINSARVYELYNQKWALPLWDAEIASVSLKMPIRLRWRKRLVVNTLIDRICTGALSKLAGIKRTCYYGPPTSERIPSDVDDDLRTMIRPEIPKPGALGAFLRRRVLFSLIKNSMRPVPPLDTLFREYCFSAGREPGKLSLAQVLEEYDTSHLPRNIRAELRLSSNVSLQGTSCESLLTAIMLARETRVTN